MGSVNVVVHGEGPTSLMGRGAGTYVSRDVVLVMKGLSGSRDVASESRDMAEDAKRKRIGSCGREKVKLRKREQTK